jgi:hypothetical protein
MKSSDAKPVQQQVGEFMTTEIKTLRDLNSLPPEQRTAVIRSMPTEQLLELKKQSQPAPQAPQAQVGAPKTGSTLSSLSDDELQSLKTMSPQDRDRYLRGVPIRNPSLGDRALETVVEVGRFIDKYTGAPARSALSAAIDDQNPISAYVTQFGEDPEKAPTGKDIAKKVGVSDKPMFSLPVIGDVSPAGAVGFGVDVLADPTTVIPVGAIAKTVGKTGYTVAKEGAKATARGVIAGSAKAAELAGAVAKPIIGEKIVATTGKMTKGVAEGMQTTGRALSKLFSPKVADDFNDLKGIAEKHGINPNILPEGVEFGENSLITRAARVQREGILGEELLDNFHNGLRQVQKATDKTVSDIGGGVVLSKVDAGAVLRDSFDKGVEKVLDNASTTYNSLIKEYPGLKISDDAMEKLSADLGGLERFAKRTATRGFSAGQRSQGEQLLNSVASIRANNGSFKQMVESLKDIGSVAFKKKNQLELDPPDVEKLQKLYGDIKDALYETIRTDVKDGEAVAGALQINNELISELFTNKSVVSRVLGNPSLGPEKVFDSLVRNGDTAKVEALKNVIDAKDWQMIKGAFVDSLIKRADDGSFSFRDLSNAMRNKKDLVEAVLGPDEIERIAELTRLGDRWGVAVMSTSGTGASNIFRDAVGAIKQGITNDAFIQTLKERARNVQYLPERPRGFSIPELPAPPPGQVFMLPEVSYKRNKALETAKQGAKVISVQDQNQRNGR